jgi:hypothetical protein
MCSKIRVHVDDGGKMQCQSQLKNTKGSIQSCHFQSDLKILPLSSYDIMVGMAGRSLSPKKFHWRQKMDGYSI